MTNKAPARGTRGSPIRFEGCTAWAVESEIIEISVGPMRFDLHNDADLVDVALNTCGSDVQIRLTFDARPLGPGIQSTAHRIDVTFQDVVVRTIRADFESQRECGLFYAFEYLGGREIGFDADCLSARFEAGTVRVTRAP